MDSSGNNRFELLFMDDDAATPTATVEVAAKKKQNPTNTTSTTAKKTKATVAPSTGAAATTGTGTATTGNKKNNPNSEKENKAGALNKNDAGKKTAAATNTGSGVGGGSSGGQQSNRPKQSSFAGNNNKRRQADEGGARVTFKSERPYRSDNASGSGGGGVGSGFGGNSGEVAARRNFREGGGGNANFSGTSGNEFNNEQRPPRQYRDNRGPPRQRFGENNYRSGKREYDRQSGSDKTGVKAIDKRDGAGAHNWGSVKQDIEDINKSNDTTTDNDATLTDKEESANEQSPDATVVQEEEEAKEMTLDEWKAMQKHTKPQFNIRKAGEGEDTSQWKKMVVLNKKKDAADSEEELEYDPSMYPQRVGRLQRIVDIQFTFNDGRRGGGFGRGRGRGGRPGGIPGGPGRFDNAGRGRGGGGGAAAGAGVDGGVGVGAGAGGMPTGSGAPVDRPIPERPRNYSNKPRVNNNALKVDDERQFPTLS